MKSYELIEHTADVGVRAYGETIGDAFAHAAVAMFDLITDSSPIKQTGAFRIKLETSDLEQLLVDWLSELLYLHDAEDLVFGRFDVRVHELNASLEAMVYGETFSSAVHKMGMQIKAVTYHMVNVQVGSPCVAQVLFDI